MEPKKPLIHFGKVPVPVPPGCFLQATADAEEAMVSLVLSHLGKAKRVADLFCGVGTFALRIAEKVQFMPLKTTRWLSQLSTVACAMCRD